MHDGRATGLLSPGRLLPFDFQAWNGLLAILDADGVARHQFVARLRGVGGNFADQDFSAFGVRFQARSCIYGVADGGVFRSPFRSNVADRDFTGVKPNTDSNLGKTFLVKFVVY